MKGGRFVGPAKSHLPALDIDVTNVKVDAKAAQELIVSHHYRAVQNWIRMQPHIGQEVELLLGVAQL